MSNDQWYTPPEILDAACAFADVPMIGLDPTASPNSPAWERSAARITEEEDALEVDWPLTPLTFMNPPYSNPAPFTEKLVETVAAARAATHPRLPSGVVLVNASTSTRWWQALAQESDYLCLCSPRIRFLRPRLDEEAILEQYGDGDPGFGVGPIHNDRSRKIWEKERDAETMYTAENGVELIDPGSPRYENVIHGFGGSGFGAFKDAFEQFGYCIPLLT